MPTARMLSTPAARARSMTSARSASKSPWSMCACVSKKAITDHTAIGVEDASHKECRRQVEIVGTCTSSRSESRWPLAHAQGFLGDGPGGGGGLQAGRQSPARPRGRAPGSAPPAAIRKSMSRSCRSVNSIGNSPVRGKAPTSTIMRQRRSASTSWSEPIAASVSSSSSCPGGT